MIARIRSTGQETWYHNVRRVWTRDDGSYLSLALDAHPGVVHFWRGGQSKVSVLLAETGADVTAMLREEMAQRLHMERS